MRIISCSSSTPSEYVFPSRTDRRERCACLIRGRPARRALQAQAPARRSRAARLPALRARATRTAPRRWRVARAHRGMGPRLRRAQHRLRSPLGSGRCPGGRGRSPPAAASQVTAALQAGFPWGCRGPRSRRRSSRFCSEAWYWNRRPSVEVSPPERPVQWPWRFFFPRDPTPDSPLPRHA